MADVPSWKIPRIVASMFCGISLSGIVFAMLVPALGAVPYWMPWPVMAVCILGVYWGLGRANRTA
jgi:uncharacterized membrane protein